jgi:membrane-associated phospholipid phosphatase
VVGTLTWLFVRHREMFPVFRTAMIVSGLVGFVFFFLFPMAPPRLVDGLGVVDTVTMHSEAYRVLQPPSLTNQFAAMPSLHVGWNLLMGIAIVSMTTNRFWKVFGVLMPLAMYLATILTANHYFVDGIVGSALALAGLAVAWKLFRPRPPVWQVVPRQVAAPQS